MGLLVIFGAGASHDCLPGGTHPWSPPLTKDVFDLGRPGYAEIAANYRGSVGLIDRVWSALQANATTTLEIELRAVLDRSEVWTERKVGLLAVQFYLSQLFMDCSNAILGVAGKRTNYTRFVDRLEEWRDRRGESVTYVTFNYDTLLDEALRGFGSLESFSQYVRPHRAYFKVHGSADWGQKVSLPHDDRSSGDYQYLIYRAADLQRERKFGVLADFRNIQMLSYVPAIAIPVEEKDELVLPESQLDELKARLPQVTRVLTFGWKARETEFMKLLKTVPTGVPVDVLTASNKGVKEAAGNLQAAGLDGPTTKRAMGFDAFVNGVEFTKLLEDL